MVQMSRQQQVDARFVNHLQRECGAAYQIDPGISVARRRNKRVVRHDDAKTGFLDSCEARAYQLNLLKRQPAAFPRQRTRAIQAKHGDFIVFEPGIHVRVNELAITVQRCKKAAEHIKKRHIVIPRHSQKRTGHLLQVPAGRSKLLAARALGKVATDDNEPRGDLAQISQQRRRKRRVFGPEVQVRDVRDDFHREVPQPAQL